MSQEILNDVELDSDQYVESPNLSSKIEQQPVDNNSSERTDIIESKEEEKQQKNVDATWWDTAYRFGENVLFVADFLGEVFAEFFGMTQSRYQWAIDAYERQKRWDEEERKKEEYHREMVMEQYKKNKNKKKNKQIENGMNQNDIKLAINNKEHFDGVIDEEEVRMNYISTNHQFVEQSQSDGKEEEEEQVEEQNDDNAPIEVS